MLQWMVTGCPDVMASSLRSNGTIRGMTNSVENNSIIISYSGAERFWDEEEGKDFGNSMGKQGEKNQRIC